MDFKIVSDITKPSIKAIEKYLKNHTGNNDIKYDWDFIEEAALVLIKGDSSELLYLSLPRGIKVNPFSYRKINQVFIIISEEKDFEKNEVYYNRLSRRLKIKGNRVKLLGLSDEKDLINEIKDIILPVTQDIHFIEEYLFYFQLETILNRTKFMSVCQENNIRNLNYTTVYPISLTKKELMKQFFEEENLIFSGFISKEYIPYFVGALNEEGFDTGKLVFQKFFKIQ